MKQHFLETKNKYQLKVIGETLGMDKVVLLELMKNEAKMRRMFHSKYSYRELVNAWDSINTESI